MKQEDVCTSVACEDGTVLYTESHGRGHPMLDGMCFKCGFDEDTCDCEEPDIQTKKKDAVI